MYFSYFVIISTWKFVGSIIWTNLNPLHPRMHYLKFGWNYPSCSGEDDYSNSSMYFCNFVFISPWKRMGPSFEETWNPLHPRYFCAKVWLKLAQWFWRSRFFKFVNVFSLFRNYLPLDALCQVCLKLVQWFWRRFVKLSMYFHNFVIISPWKRMGPLFEQTNALHPMMIYAKFGWNWPSEFWRRWKCEKFTTTTTDHGQIFIRKAHLSLQLR